jgi:PAS domain S-box-containing protein
MDDSDILRALKNVSHGYVFLKDSSGRFTFVNQQFATLFGAQPNDLLGKTDWDLIEPADIERFRAADEAVLKSGVEITQDELFRPANGGERLLSVVKTPIKAHDGDVIGVLGFASDVTEQNQTHAARLSELLETQRILRETETQLKEIRQQTETSDPVVGNPKVFISYRHVSEDHATWVRRFGTDLIEVYGIDCILDQFDLDYGDSIQEFMQRIQTEATHVLLIVTPETVTAIESNTGGVAFEAQLAAARRDRGKVQLIPVLRAGSETPAYVQSHLYIDFRRDELYRDMLKRLAGSISQKRTRPVSRSRSDEAPK